MYNILICYDYGFIGQGNGNSLQYSCLGNPVDRGAWWAAVHGVVQSQTPLKRVSMHACIGEGNGNPLQWSCLENPQDGGARWAAIYGVARSRTRLRWQQRQQQHGFILCFFLSSLARSILLGQFYFMWFFLTVLSSKSDKLYCILVVFQKPCNQSLQSLSRVGLFGTPWTTAHQACLSITNSQSLLKLMSIESVMPAIHLILCHPLLLLPSIFPSTRVFSNESVLHIRGPNCWSFSFSISPSNECSGLISFRMDWLDLLAVQGTLKSLLQYHGSKASVLWHSAFFIVHLSHPYMTTGKTIALSRQTFVGNVYAF